MSDRALSREADEWWQHYWRESHSWITCDDRDNLRVAVEASIRAASDERLDRLERAVGELIGAAERMAAELGCNPKGGTFGNINDARAALSAPAAGAPEGGKVTAAPSDGSKEMMEPTVHPGAAGAGAGALTKEPGPRGEPFGHMRQVTAAIRAVTAEMREAVPTQADWHVESSAVARWHDTLLEAIRLNETLWTPTAENVNALPDPLRKYIHDLETRCDPAGDVRTVAVLQDNLAALGIKAEELEKSLLSTEYMFARATPEPVERPETAGERIEGMRQVGADIRGTAAKLLERAGRREDDDARFMVRMALACDMHARDLGYYDPPQGGEGGGEAPDTATSEKSLQRGLVASGVGQEERSAPGTGEKGDEDASTREGEGLDPAAAYYERQGLRADRLDASDTPDSPATPVDQGDVRLLPTNAATLDGCYPVFSIGGGLYVRVTDYNALSDVRAEKMSVMQDDIAELLRALGLSDHARPASPHDVMANEAIPAARSLRAENQALRERRWTDEDMREAWTASWMRSLWEADKLDAEEPDFTRWLSTRKAGEAPRG